MLLKTWKKLIPQVSPFKGEGRYPISAYSEFMPSVRLGWKPYEGKIDPFFFDKSDLWRWPVTEFEEAFELRPGLENIGHQILNSLIHLGRGEPGHGIAKNKLFNNPYWPPELAKRARTLDHERYLTLLPVALSRTQDDKGRVRWTLFGGSEQGPARPFWKSFFKAPGKEIPEEEAFRFFAELLRTVYGEHVKNFADLHQAGFRIFLKNRNSPEDFLPTWTSPFLWKEEMPIKRVKYLLTFESFGNLPASARKAYLAKDLYLLPFPGSLIFWGAPGYLHLQGEMAMAIQIPLLHAVARHEGPHGIRIPQSGWLHEPHPESPLPHADYGPVRNTFRRTHRWARVHRHEDELMTEGREDKLLHVLFSTAPKDLDLYGKPMARNAQIWTHDYHLLLDGPQAAKREIDMAFHSVRQGGLFGYRFQFPPMCVGAYQVYWHRPLIAYLSSETQKPALFLNPLLGYLTAYTGKGTDLNHSPVELWPRLLTRNTYQSIIEVFKDKPHGPQTISRAINLLEAQRLLRVQRTPRSFARQLLMLPKDRTLDEWFDSLTGIGSDVNKIRELSDQLQDKVEPKLRSLRRSKRNRLPDSLTFRHSSLRSFEVRYWKDIVVLSEGNYLNKANSDCIEDEVTHQMLKHHHRDLEALGDYLLAYYGGLAVTFRLEGKALVGYLPFEWKTDFDFDWWGGWVNNRKGRTQERNLMVVIPGRDRRRAIIMADHYDTAYMENVYYKDRGGNGGRLAAPGADDNHSGTAALMRAAPVFCRLSKEGRLGCDIWLVHLTGEEFPADCLGARHLCECLVERSLKLRLKDGKEHDLSGVRVQGAFILDMVAHNNGNERDVFQICPGTGLESAWLAYQAHIANENWNGSTFIWNQHPSRRHHDRRERRSRGKSVPPVAPHPRLDGQIRLPRDPKSTLYNTDGQIFSDAGIPVVLFMEDYDINRTGYHDSFDTMENIDLDYGSAVVAIAIESVARSARERQPCGLLKRRP